MKSNDLWERYCSFDEKDYSEQMDYNKQRMEHYFHKWRKTDLAKILCRGRPEGLRDVPATTYSDYPMLTRFGQEMEETITKNIGS